MFKPTYDRHILTSLMKESFVMLINLGRTQAAGQVLSMANHTQTVKDLPAAYNAWYECEKVMYDNLFTNANTK